MHILKIGITHVVMCCLLSMMIWPVTETSASSPVITYLGALKARLAAPAGLAVDQSGNLYVSDEQRGSISKFDPYGRIVMSMPGLSIVGSGLAVTPDGLRIFFSTGQSVGVLDGERGNLLGYLGTGADEFGEVTGIAVSADGEVLVADNRTPTIRLYDGAGIFIRQFGGSSVTAGALGGISALTVDAVRGEVYVADNTDPANARVQIFSLAGLPLRTLGREDFGAESVVGFGEMTFDGAGRGYFLFPKQHQVGVMALSGVPLQRFSETTVDAPPLAGLIDAAYDPLFNLIYVICHGGRIEILGIDGGQLPVPAEPIAVDAPFDAQLDKLFQIEQLVRVVAPELSVLVSAIETRIWARDTNGVALLITDLLRQAPEEGGLAEKVAELEGLLL